MSQVMKISRNNTSVTNATRNGRDYATFVTLHQTRIVEVTPETIVLDTGGWNTATTRTRMNQASNELGLGYKVAMRGGRFIVEYGGVEHVISGSKAYLDRETHAVNEIDPSTLPY